MASARFDASKQETGWQRLFGGGGGRDKPKLRVEDPVSASKVKRWIEKGYMPCWSEVLFIIGEVHPSDPLVYRHQTYTKISVSKDKRDRVEAVL